MSAASWSFSNLSTDVSVLRQMLRRNPLGLGVVASNIVILHTRVAGADFFGAVSMNSSPLQSHFFMIRSLDEVSWMSCLA